jgi:hypothetical protein
VALAPLALVLVNACAITERRVDERAEPDASAAAAPPEVGGSAGSSGVGPQPEPEPSPTAVPCDPSALFTSQELVVGLDAPGSYAERLWLSADELEAYFIAVTGQERAVWHASRAARGLPFEARKPWAASGASDVFDLAVIADGRLLVEWRSGDGSELVELTRTLAATARLVMSDAADPWLSADGQRLYFIRQNGSLCLATWGKNGFVGGGVVFGSGAFGSSAVGRGGPVLTQDERALYYSEPFAGQTDIYLARRSGLSFVYAGAFGSLNSDTENESPDWLSPDGCRLYFERRALDGSDVQIFMASK